MEKVFEQYRLAGVPLFLWGIPGVGKSAIIEQYAIKKKLPFKAIVCPAADETDISGVIFPYKGNAKHAAPEWSKEFGKQGVVVFEEITAARREVADSCLTLIQSRLFPDGTRLGKEVLLVAAANPVEQIDGVHLSPALKNRFGHITVKPDIDKFTAYLVEQGYGTYVPLVKFVVEKAGWSSPDDFVKNKENLFLTPRSIHNLLRISATPADVLAYASQFIPHAAAVAVKIFLEEKAEKKEGNIFKTHGNFTDKLKRYLHD